MVCFVGSLVQSNAVLVVHYNIICMVHLNIVCVVHSNVVCVVGCVLNFNTIYLVGVFSTTM